MKTVCELNKCTGCMACVDVCAKKAINVNVTMLSCNAEINETMCISCGACSKVCQINDPVSLEKPMSWYQGWSKSEEIRKNCASGGFATEIAKAFIIQRGTVFACMFEKGEFKYRAFVSVDDLPKIAGSKYVKSNPVGVYKKIKEELLNGKKVLFIGLPCHVAGVQKYLNDKLIEKLYTIDLICHGSPAPQLLDVFLKEHQIELRNLNAIRFRQKDYFRAERSMKQGYRSVGTSGVLDSYTIGFLKGLFYTENCYECRYAKLSRISDITLGDSWGSELPITEQKKGISLALCQTKKGENILKMSNVELHSVDLNLAQKHNHQLSFPSVSPKQRNKFLTMINLHKSFDSAIWRTCFVKSIKQEIKKILRRLKIYRRKSEFRVSVK